MSFGIINPISESIINFSNNLLRLKVPPGSTNDIVSCLIFINKRNDYEIDFVSEIIEIIPENMQLNNPAKLSFNLDIFSCSSQPIVSMFN